ncbi:MAG: hypothetical protein QM638_21715 [Nocardioides sp.]|uniref:hypothetical protein n=1 Tax=Nocardioides sp. TaxID=35761 RepID=UPI0039E49DAE
MWLSRIAVAATALVLAPALVACGSGGTSSYCSEVSDQQSKLTDTLAGGDAAALLAALPIFTALEEKAPSDIADDWRTLVDALNGLQTALDAAGVKASDYVDGKPPAGTSAADRRSILKAADKVSTTAVQEAAVNVQQQARDVCHTSLTL